VNALERGEVKNAVGALPYAIAVIAAGAGSLNLKTRARKSRRKIPAA
jgi:hypothetical protein